MNQKEKLIELIGVEDYNKWDIKIPPKFKQEELFIVHSEWLLQKTPKEIMHFYEELKNDQRPLSTLNMAGAIMVVSTHINNLLHKLVQIEEPPNLVSEINKLDFHHLIIFCTSRYNRPEDEFEQMMELKSFRNMIAHEFDSTMETTFHQAIHPIIEGEMLVISLTDTIRNKLQKHTN